MATRAAEAGCFDVCPTHCGVCQAPLRGSHLRLLVEHLRNAAREQETPLADEGRLAHELGLAPCCAALALGRRAEQESVRRYLDWSRAAALAPAPPGDALREATEALHDGLLYAGVLRDLGATLDRAYLDGLAAHASLPNGIRLDGTVRAHLEAEVLAPEARALRLPGGSTVARVQVRVRCTLGAETRAVRAWCHVPAPLGGYLTTADGKSGNVMHVALRTGLVPNEVEARAESATRSTARMLAAPASRGAQQVMLRLVLSWRGPTELRETSLSLPAPVSQAYERQASERRPAREEVPLETMLRALFGLSGGPVGCEDAAEIKRLFFDTCRRRTGCVVDAGDVLRQDARLAEYLFDDRVMNGHSGLATEEPLLERARSHLRRLGAAARPLEAPERGALYRATAQLVGGGAEDDAPAYGAEAVAAAAALDCLARLFIHAVRVHLDPKGEPAEQARSVTWPGAVARDAVRAALRSLLHAAARSLAERAAPGDEAPAPPRSLGLVMQGAAPPGVRATTLEWLPEEGECPACGRAPPEPGAVCARCRDESREELARTPLPFALGPATARRAPPLRLRGSGVPEESTCWWNASPDAAGARFGYRYRHLARARQAAALAARAASRFAAPVRPGRGAMRAVRRVGYLPAPERRVLRRAFFGKKKKRRQDERGGSGLPAARAAARALAREQGARSRLACTAAARLLQETVCAGLAGALHQELRGGARPPCLAVADPEEGGPHQASVVNTGIVGSQVDSAHGRRRPHPELEGVRDGGYNHEKTTEQRRVLCVGVHWSPALDEEELGAVCECAALALRDLRRDRPAAAAPGVADFARLRLGQGSLVATAAALRAPRCALLRCPGDESLTSAEHEHLSLLEALDYNRALQRRVRERLLEFRVGEVAELKESGARARVLGALLELEGGATCGAEPYVVGRRLPRPGDLVCRDGQWVRVAGVASLLLEAGARVEPRRLRKLPPRGDGGKLPALAYVNAVLDEREGTVDIRVQGGFACLPVQLAPVAPQPRRETWSHFLEDVAAGRVGVWHAAALVLEEEVNTEAELLSPAGEPLPMRFRYLLGEAAMRGARAGAMPSALGHIVRLAAQLRALGQCAREPPAEAVAPWGALVSGPSVDGGLAISPGALSPPGAAPGMLFHIALVDDLGSKTWEDAGVTDQGFLASLGRCLHSVTEHVPPSPSSGRLLTRAEAAALPEVDEEAVRRLDRDGRAHGPLRQGDALAFAQDGTPLPCPFDAIAEHWGTTLRGLPSVTLVVQEPWASGIKVVWSLQKSVLTTVEAMVVAPQAISYVRSEPSCVSRNAPSTWLAARMLELSHARGFASHRASCKRRLPAHAELLDGTLPASAARVRAARQMAPGISSNGLYPLVDRLSGRDAGTAFVGPQYQGLSLKNSAAQKLSLHLGPGSRARRGALESRGQRGERMEQCLTHCNGAFGPNRPAGATGAFAPPARIEARARMLARFGAALAQRPEHDEDDP